ncbi:MAG: 2-oxoacid:ferredoxin oxidoreductase subunit beta [Bacteroidia bacterium]|jgi:2-oxoglutarate ferredoxin oxidoreductase subunit beta|nr:2-oxoacid:ferredoxin oxidoreductase subunit beta [Bacteroidia bacterium]MCO5254437.1 2-oxoacid:ferredoxin oxidoreductase subunit beta [Bacteroidota bacterium]MCZ2129997.1 2-oxoacid:ferredoxin oxidoreductase subunit beta [Bacteroidia bacterium]
MTFYKPVFRHPELPKNKLGYTSAEYEGTISTLCAGCGHDSISTAIVQACFELDIEPHKVAKLSGIGCSSKTPAYFLSNSHGFNSVHGRMPAVATGANLANKDLLYIGVSGDGDSASIGMGQFVHVIRKNLNMVYICMNNGVYGLTKGQDSATADVGSISKAGSVNPYPPIDLASLAIELGASFVAQSFSGDKDQLNPLLKAAINHPGFAFLNIVSPCVTFNNNPGSTKSYQFVREHAACTGRTDYVPVMDTITKSYAEGELTSIELHDGSVLQFHKLDNDWNPEDRLSAIAALKKAEAKQEVLTGLLYINRNPKELHQILNTSDTPLNRLNEGALCPGNDILRDINEGFR